MKEYKTLRYQLTKLERTMLHNIANSLFALHFHQEATTAELMQYYGLSEPMNDLERAKLIDDTLKNIEHEQFILRFYQKEMLNLYKKYAEKNPTGDLGVPVRQPVGDTLVEGNQDTSDEAATGIESGGDKDEPNNDGGGEDNGSAVIGEGIGEDRGRQDVARRDGEDDRGGDDSGDNK
jgi:hypothetical protein